MIRALHVSLLLSVRAPQLHESTIYAAFRQGLDQALYPTYHFIDVSMSLDNLFQCILPGYRRLIQVSSI